MKLQVVIFLVNLSLQLKKDLSSNGKWCLAGYPNGSMKVSLIDGSYHASILIHYLLKFVQVQLSVKHSKSCKPVLLEPIMKMEVITPEQNMGDVVGDLK
jgi:elongation factor G